MLIDKRGHFGRSASSSVSEKHRGGLQNLVRAAQLVVLALEPLDLLMLLRGRQIRPQALIGPRPGAHAFSASRPAARCPWPHARAPARAPPRAAHRRRSAPGGTSLDL